MTHLRLVDTGEPEAILREAVREAVERNQIELYGRARTSENWRSVSFEFALHLRGHPELRDLDPAAAADVLEPILCELLEAGEIEEQEIVFENAEDGDEHGFAPSPVTPWTRALGDCDSAINQQDPEQNFLNCWERLEPRPDLAGAVEEAQRRHLTSYVAEFGDRWSSTRYTGRRLLLRICMVLAEMSLDGTFPLAQYALQRELGVPQRTLSDWIAWAVREGFLVQVVAYRIKVRSAIYQLGPKLGRSSA